MAKPKKKKLKIRLPVPQKASRPIGTKKGKKGYKRRKKHREKNYLVEEILDYGQVPKAQKV